VNRHIERQAKESEEGMTAGESAAGKDTQLNGVADETPATTVKPG